jgi:hypothetical protein
MLPDKPYPIASFNQNQELFTRLQTGELERPALFLVSQAINELMEARDIVPQLGWDHVTGRPGLKLRPFGLMNAIGLQFALAVEGDKRYRQCR